jgi:DeoR family transcriptional regulator, suf operon transcriptional repressor
VAVSELVLDDSTRGKIIEALAVSPRSARDLAHKLGIQESAVRGHLDRLEDRGLVSPSFHREGVGRPKKRYVLTAQGQDLFPRRYEFLLDSVMEELLAQEGEGYTSALFAEAARRMARQIAAEIPPTGTREERVRALADALNKLGFRAQVQTLPDGEVRINRTNCVFRHTALTHAYLLCEVFDKNLTEALLGQSGLQLEDSITRGGLTCTHLIQLR